MTLATSEKMKSKRYELDKKNPLNLRKRSYIHPVGSSFTIVECHGFLLTICTSIQAKCKSKRL